MHFDDATGFIRGNQPIAFEHGLYISLFFEPEQMKYIYHWGIPDGRYEKHMKILNEKYLSQINEHA